MQQRACPPVEKDISMTRAQGSLFGLCLAAAAMTLAVPAASEAASISGAGPLGSFTGTLTYNASSDTQATLNVSLSNTSPTANGGYLTAFVLNNPGGITGVALTSAPNNFWSVLGLTNNGVNAAPYGQFDFGASTGNGFEGGGQPSRGIATGASGSFAFSLTGSGLLSLSDTTFLTTLSSGPGIGQGAEDFVARFRGFENGGSDKVPNSAMEAGSGTGDGGGVGVCV
ncbi:hypothetical protein, partial [Paracraurococcus ruber]